MQNGYVERFNRFYREDVLDAYLFSSIQELRLLSEEWMEFYNEKHPHESLNDMSPREHRLFDALLNELSLCNIL